MLKYLKGSKFVKKDKSEFRASLIIVITGTFVSALLPSHGAKFYPPLLFGACVVVGFFCSLNAVLDFASMGLIERITNIVWFCIMFGAMLILLSVALYDMTN